ncbi:sulfurtransferase complex subunit TusB [Hahella sp. KA22]|uniref:sulfurtransferase complex subunit TusB n=1 Tax=Hahella sp. KA22 TaxID=1628392 RepID=UPI000FDD13A0|nr:sulfurtransferase complex subunit TusB [Hahella sp. KA22]AZZ91804.1 sulfurtransferase complex subunit TusB [Hahella sp. KA22]QAY55174.1 sulfurtransferase complex subunit TusB [Hahella sp. KA22]
MVLHIFNKGIRHRELLKTCAELIGPDDSLLLIEDGVIWAKEHRENALIQGLLDAGVKVYALKEDLMARGIAAADAIAIADYAQFVELTERHPRSVSWF